MRLRLSWHIFFVFFFIIQINDVGSAKMDDESLLLLQLRVENLIEKIINFLQDYYKQIKSDLKCIPDFVTTNLIEIIKEAVECVDRNERYFSEYNGTMKHQSKKFLECFTNAKRGVRNMMNSVNTSIDYCPVNMTEKTYQINVSTIFTKTFRINIRNGVEMLKKEIELERDSKHCFDHSTDDDEDEGVPEGKRDKSKENTDESMEGSGRTAYSFHHSERRKHRKHKTKHTIVTHGFTTIEPTDSDMDGELSGELVKMDPDGSLHESEEAMMRLRENGPENLDDSLVYPDKLGDYDNVEGMLYNEQAEEANLGGYLEYRDSSGTDSNDSDFVIDVVDDTDPDGEEENPEEEEEEEEEEQREERQEVVEEEEEEEEMKEEAHSATSKSQEAKSRRTDRVFNQDDDTEKPSEDYGVSEDKNPDTSATDNMSDTAELE